jgi:hypothetical protein
MSLYVKNVPPAERTLRLLVSAVVVLLALVYLADPWRPIVAASGAGFALTGVLGFCPACALIGRRLRA